MTSTTEGFERALDDGIQLLPKIGYFLLILIVGILLAKVVQGVLTKVLQKVGFDRLVERGGIKQALDKSQYDAAGILAKIVYYFIFLLVLSAAFGVFGPENPVSRFLERVIAFLPNLFVAVLVLVLAAAIAAAVKELLTALLGGLSFGPVLAGAASTVVIVIGVFFALDQLQIAPLIVGGVFYALLALVVVPPIIAFGVGGIEPARDAIRSLTARAGGAAQQVQQEVASAPTAVADEDVPGSGAEAPRPRARRTAGSTSTRRPRA